MNIIVEFSLTLLIILRICCIILSIDFFYRTKNSKHVIYAFGWFLWLIAGIIPLVLDTFNNVFLSEFISINNPLLGTLAIIVLIWGFVSSIIIISRKTIVYTSFIIIIFGYLLFFTFGSSIAVNFFSITINSTWSGILIFTLIKRKELKEHVNKNIRWYLYLLAIIGFVYVPLGILIYISGYSYGLYTAENSLLISLNYGYAITLTFLMNVLYYLLEYRISNDLKHTLKDKYSHDLGNTLQNIYTSIDLLGSSVLNEEDSSDIRNLLDTKMKEASKLLDEIRDL